MDSRVTERQRDGATVIVVITLLLIVCSRSPSFLFPEPDLLRFGDHSSGPVIVELAGVAGCSGVFYLHQKATIRDLFQAASVRTQESFGQKVLGTPLSKGKMVLVESENELIITDMSNANKLMLGIPVDINKATLDDLVLVAGIGEKTAQYIIEWRERSGRFHRVEDLMKVRGIKEKKFKRFSDNFCTDCMSPE